MARVKTSNMHKNKMSKLRAKGNILKHDVS